MVTKKTDHSPPFSSELKQIDEYKNLLGSAPSFNTARLAIVIASLGASLVLALDTALGPFPQSQGISALLLAPEGTDKHKIEVVIKKGNS